MHWFNRPTRVLVTGLAATLTALSLTAAAHAATSLPSPPSFDAAAAAKAGHSPAASGAGGNRALERQAALLPTANRLIKEAQAPDSAIAGVTVDPDAGVLNVYTTDPSRKPAGAASLAAGTELRLHAAAFNRTAMTAAVTRLQNDGKALGQQRIDIAGIGPNEDGSGITVTIVGDDDARSVAARRLRARYGAIVANVRAVAKHTSPDDLYFAGFRFNDYAAWYGGDRIMTSSSGCTSGFAATYNGAPAMLTTAHCGSVGTGFSNGPRSNNSFSFMGTMNYDNDNTDIATIGVSSASNSINVGSDPQVPSQRYIGTWGSPVVGQYMCQSGSYTGERCNLRVVATYQSECRSYFIWCTAWWSPLSDVINTAGSGSPAAGHGDSGAPVYLQGTSVGMGLVHGPLTANTAAVYPAYGGDTMWCPSPEGWQQRCSSGFSFAHLPGH